MSLLRICSRQVRSIPNTLRPMVPFVRFNSASTSKISLTAQVYPIEKEAIGEKEVDEWLSAIKDLKRGKIAVESETEVYLNQLANPEPFLSEKFEPSEEQLAQLDAFADKKIPLKSDPLVDNLTNLIMRHGKKSQARKVVSRALYIIYLKTRSDPVEILRETLDKLGPLVITKTVLTGYAKNMVVPFPLNERQRNRYAINWILDGSKNKKSPNMSVRLAEEIISAYEGKSSGYDKKAQMHKLAMQQRAYIQL